MYHLDKYTKEELTVNIMKAQMSPLLYFIPFALLFGVPYYLLWIDDTNLDFVKIMGKQFKGYGILILCIGIIIHELLHGLTWSFFAKSGFKSIKFGIVLKWLTPYCHCKEPLLVKHYIIGALIPGLVLGIIPTAISIFNGNPYLFGYGLIFTLTAGGDFMMINIIMKESKDALVQDHPSKIGCYIYREKDL
jgi:hypothetical protein